MLFEAFVLRLAKEMPVVQIAELVGQTDTRIWCIVREYVNRTYEKKRFESTGKLGVDETSSRKGYNYVIMFADMDSGDVLFAAEGKDSGALKAFVDEMPKHVADVKEITMDMSVSFISGAAAYVVDADVTFDKFPQALNKAQDEVWRAEQKQNPLLKRTQCIWLKGPENLTVEQKKELERLHFENLKTVKLYQMKLRFQDMYRCYLESRLTSGAMECMNSCIQENKPCVKGFRNISNFIAMIYLEAAGLNFAAPS